MPDSTPMEPPSSAAIEAAVRAVLESLSGDLTGAEAVLLAELDLLHSEIARAKEEIATIGVGDIRENHIPTMTGELDAVVSHLASATNTILDSCEALEDLQSTLDGDAADALGGAVTRIYEACNFQDITGQRIARIVSVLQTVEGRVTAVHNALGSARGTGAPAEAAQAPAAAVPEGRALAHGPQLPGAGTSQDDIDRLLASFE